MSGRRCVLPIIGSGKGPGNCRGSGSVSQCVLRAAHRSETEVEHLRIVHVQRQYGNTDKNSYHMDSITLDGRLSDVEQHRPLAW